MSKDREPSPEAQTTTQCTFGSTCPVCGSAAEPVVVDVPYFCPIWQQANPDKAPGAHRDQEEAANV